MYNRYDTHAPRCKGESSALGPDMLYIWMTFNPIHDIFVSKKEKKKLGPKSCTATQAGLSKRAAQAINSHVLFALSPEKLLSHHSNKAASITKESPTVRHSVSCILHYFPQTVSTACDCVLFRVTAVAQPKCRLTLFLPPRPSCFIRTLGGSSLHDAL